MDGANFPDGSGSEERPSNFRDTREIAGGRRGTLATSSGSIAAQDEVVSNIPMSTGLFSGRASRSGA
jgi:hypothetical protein